MMPPAAQGSATVQEIASALITVFEGCRLTAYQDSGGVWTIGHGHTGRVGGVLITKGLTISQAQADALLVQDQAPLFALVKDMPALEAAALVSFGYNCGVGNLQKVLAGHAFVTQFTKDSHGNVLPGLVARRALEDVLIATAQQMARK